MGGTGSGRWTYHNKKRTVEECWAIDISDVARLIDLQDFGPAPRYIKPTTPSRGTRMPSMRCSLESDDNDERLLRLIYTADGRWDFVHRVEQLVPLQTTRPHFGGVRWWFTCPSVTNGTRCGRRVGKLYRPSGGRYFACRHCLDLTYESCQKSHRYDQLFALMAGEASGEAFEAMKRAFAYQRKEGRKRRLVSSPMLLNALDEMLGEGKRQLMHSLQEDRGSLIPGPRSARIRVASALHPFPEGIAHTPLDTSFVAIGRPSHSSGL